MVSKSSTEIKVIEITCRENPGPLDENLSEVVRVPDVVPESLRSLHQFDRSRLGVFSGLAALRLGFTEDDIAGEVDQGDGHQAVPGQFNRAKI